MSSLLDCLVLGISDLSTFKLYILYDTKKNIYELRGKNINFQPKDSASESESDSESHLVSESDSDSDFLPFSFKSKKCKHLIEFIEFMTSLNTCEFTMFNYNNLPPNSNKITFDFLDNHQEYKRELFCYEKEGFDKDMCKKLLKMIKNIYNNY
jgi:hypothetical protein